MGRLPLKGSRLQPPNPGYSMRTKDMLLIYALLPLRNRLTLLPILHAPQSIVARIARLANWPNMINRKVVANDADLDQSAVST
jgi:hypothetical protein